MIDIYAVCDVLDELYHSPNLGNKTDPLDELMFIVLAKKTAESSFVNCFDLLTDKYKSWEKVRKADENEVESLIKPGGLAKIKTKQVKRILNQIKEETKGSINLNFLIEYSDEDAEKYLLGLYGVGIKTAKCVLMYALNRKVLPVDTHTYRLAHELELVTETYMRNEKGKLHLSLENLIPPDLRYKFHVNAVMHGRLEHSKRIKPPVRCALIETLISRGIFQPSLH